LEWFDTVSGDALHLSVLTIGEIRKGIEALRERKRRERLRVWLERDLADWFGERLLPVDAAVADRWGWILADAGRPLPAIDSLIAATALHHDLRLVTRNVRDFDFARLDIVNPWNL
jgi:predicted nucleic acid-binding protein